MYLFEPSSPFPTISSRPACQESSRCVRQRTTAETDTSRCVCSPLRTGQARYLPRENGQLQGVRYLPGSDADSAECVPPLEHQHSHLQAQDPRPCFPVSVLLPFGLKVAASQGPSLVSAVSNEQSLVPRILSVIFFFFALTFVTPVSSHAVCPLQPATLTRNSFLSSWSYFLSGFRPNGKHSHSSLLSAFFFPNVTASAVSIAGEFFRTECLLLDWLRSHPPWQHPG